MAARRSQGRSRRGRRQLRDGGFVEVSGKQVLAYNGTTDTRAPYGSFGTLLLDPGDMTIQNDGDTSFTGSNTENTTLAVAVLNSALALNNVIVQTGTAPTGPGSGDIIVNAEILWSAGTTLTLSAFRDIRLPELARQAPTPNIRNTGAGHLVLRADSTGTGTGTILMPPGTSPTLRQLDRQHWHRDSLLQPDDLRHAGCLHRRQRSFRPRLAGPAHAVHAGQQLRQSGGHRHECHHAGRKIRAGQRHRRAVHRHPQHVHRRVRRAGQHAQRDPHRSRHLRHQRRHHSQSQPAERHRRGQCGACRHSRRHQLGADRERYADRWQRQQLAGGRIDGRPCWLEQRHHPQRRLPAERLPDGRCG